MALASMTSGAWFAYERGWIRMGLWWCVKGQIGDVNYEVN